MATTGQSTSTGARRDLQRHDGGGDGLLRIHLHRQLGRRPRAHITTPISPTYAAQILQLQEAGATEDDPHPIVAEAITESYFTEWGTRTDGLRVDFTHVRSIDFEF